MAAAAFLLAFFASQPLLARADVVMVSEARQLREEVRDMFYHAFDGYMQHAFPRDELRPLTCQGEDTLGGYALTLIDSLDTLALLGDRERFGSAVEWIGENVRFDIGHAHVGSSSLDELMCSSIISRGFLHALRVPRRQRAASWAAGQQQILAVVFGQQAGGLEQISDSSFWFSRMLDSSFLDSKILDSKLHQLEILDSNWTATEQQLNKTVSVFETTIRVLGGLLSAHLIASDYSTAYLLFGDDEYLFMFQEAYKAAMHYLYHDPWYVEVNMNSAVTVWPLFNSLQAFWPGLQVLYGDIAPAIRTHAAFFSVWKRYGFTPEGFNLASFSIQSGQRSYPLRPELIESTYWLFKATRDFRYLDAGRDMVASIQYGARCPCGYCHIADVESHKQDDHMESFFLAETVKYLWLLFDLAAGPDNIVENGPYKYIFNTEGHLLPATAEIALANEHCSYLGAFCRDGGERDAFTGISSSYQEANDTRITDSWMSSSSPSEAENSFTTSSFIKGFCPALTHDQKFGFSYTADKHGTHNVEPANQHQSHSAIMISEPLVMHSAAIDKSYSSQYPENPHREEIEKNSSDEKDSQLVREQIQT
ncbi:putative alpha-mannosidase I MNS4 [Dendrobium catenatum]|uniref:alpha-1,2-Mannosidase n=1 Tax=Dendrobium catenatum TaxID=906689 RepID=A0A2I0W911_9ASPA|nr:putative alpha-mannosidase I MNS4 [Dendrobium catenatum]